MRRTTIAIAVTVVFAFAACSGDATPSGAASEPAPTTSAAPALDVAGTWTSDAPDEAAIEIALGTDLAAWAGELAGDVGEPLTLTLEDGDYAIETSGGDVLKEGAYEVDGEQLKLQVDPNGVTVLDVSLDGDEMTLTFVSNSTQDYPPDMVPEEAVQRALFTSVPFVRA